jgi:EAL domain-containing protein (putative c-di-GMP-specific phosphodiesterase class I)
MAAPNARGGVRGEVARAIEAGEFELHFQPIAAIASGRIEALEALIRWNHPRQGILTPALFLPGIEQSDAAWTFTRHVLESAAAHARDWIAAGYASQVAVNISAHLVNRRLADELPELLADSGVPPRMVLLEITESAVMDDPVAATRALDRLAEIGLGGIAIDDFGAGHSSLGRLRDLPIDALKIDRSFVAELDRGVDPAFVRSVIELAHYLGLRVVAEGVEDELTWRSLAHFGCDCGQGFWLSPPLRASDVHNWLARHDPHELACVGVISERRQGVGRRSLDRVAGAFDRAPRAMLMSDHGQRWVAVNAAARSLLRIEASALLERRIVDTATDGDGNDLAALLEKLAREPQLTGTCEVTIGDGSRRRVRYELRRSVVPGHHVWLIAAADDG